MYNVNQDFVSNLIPYFSAGYDPAQATPNSNFVTPNIANPYLKYLQIRFDMLFLLSDVFYYLNQIAAGNPITFNNPPNNYTLQEPDLLEFLSYIGNIIGLPYFNLSTITGFILNVSQLSVDELGPIVSVSTISGQSYANLLLARFYKFYSNCSLNNIINSVQLVSQKPLSAISLVVSSTTLSFTINCISDTDSQATQSLIDYTDSLGYNLWMRPTYGIVEFTYVIV